MDFDEADMDNVATGPLGAAFAWIKQVSASSDVDSWFRLDSSLRRWLAQDWLMRNPSALRDPTAGGLAKDALVTALICDSGPDHPLFVHLWRVSRRKILGVLAPFEGDELAAGSRVRAISPDIEAVPFFRAVDLHVREGVGVLEPGAEAMSLPLLLRNEGGEWFVISFGAWLPVPGWPPEIEPLAEGSLD